MPIFRRVAALAGTATLVAAGGVATAHALEEGAPALDSPPNHGAKPSPHSDPNQLAVNEAIARCVESGWGAGKLTLSKPEAGSLFVERCVLGAEKDAAAPVAISYWELPASVRNMFLGEGVNLSHQWATEDVPKAEQGAKFVYWVNHVVSQQEHSQAVHAQKVLEAPAKMRREIAAVDTDATRDAKRFAHVNDAEYLRTMAEMYGLDSVIGYMDTTRALPHAADVAGLGSAARADLRVAQARSEKAPPDRAARVYEVSILGAEDRLYDQLDHLEKLAHPSHHPSKEAAQQPSGQTQSGGQAQTETPTGPDPLTDPLNPLSPLSPFNPSNPMNPSSPLNPLNPLHPASPFHVG